MNEMDILYDRRGELSEAKKYLNKENRVFLANGMRELERKYKKIEATTLIAIDRNSETPYTGADGKKYGMLLPCGYEWVMLCFEEVLESVLGRTVCRIDDKANPIKVVKVIYTKEADEGRRYNYGTTEIFLEGVKEPISNDDLMKDYVFSHNGLPCASREPVRNY